MSVIYLTSNKPRAGKTSLAVSLAKQLSSQGKNVNTFKPFYTLGNPIAQEFDSQILQDASTNGPDKTKDWPIAISADQDVPNEEIVRAMEPFAQLKSKADVTIVEGVSGLEGPTASLSGKIVSMIDAKVLVVLRHEEDRNVEEATLAKAIFGDRLAGVLLNGVTAYKKRQVTTNLEPALESSGVNFIGFIPEDRRLLGVTARQLADHIGGQFLSWEDKQDNLVEHIMIGGLVLDWGVLYFQQHENKAVIVRADRPDIQMAALGTPTSCIVLTGGQAPIQYIEYESQEEEIPLIQVQSDTLSTTAALETIQEVAKFDHPLKHERFIQLMESQGVWDNIYASIDI